MFQLYSYDSGGGPRYFASRREAETDRRDLAAQLGIDLDHYHSRVGEVEAVAFTREKIAKMLNDLNGSAIRPSTWKP